MLEPARGWRFGVVAGDCEALGLVGELNPLQLRGHVLPAHAALNDCHFWSTSLECLSMMRVGTSERIVSAALPVFADRGWTGASMAAIRRAAGVSNGSLYHHFGSRAELAARLLVDGMTDAQQAVVGVLAQAGSAEQGVREVVRAQLVWVEESAGLARLLYADLPDEVLLAAEPAFSEHNRRYVDLVGDWLRGHAQQHTVIDAPFGVAHALWLGPAQEFARHWLRGRSKLRPAAAAPALADGAWRALASG